MRFDFLIQSNFAPDNIGGIETVVSQMVNSLAGTDICVFYGGDRTQSFTKKKVTFRENKIIFSVRGLNILAWGNARFFILGLRSKIIIMNEPFPSLWPAVLFLKLLGKNIKIFHHATPEIPAIAKWLFLLLRGSIYAGSMLATTSPQLGKEFGGKPIQIIPLSISEDRKEKKPNFDLPERYFLFLGRLGTYKGISELAAAINRCPHVQFVIVGRGPQDFLISNEFLSSNPNVIFRNNFVSEEEKNYLLKNCDVLLFPSTNSGEAFGIVQLEAMFYGKPIINTFLDTGVNYVGIDKINAITIPPRDADLLAKAIKSLWADSKMRGDLALGAKKRYCDVFSSTANREKLKRFLVE